MYPVVPKKDLTNKIVSRKWHDFSRFFHPAIDWKESGSTSYLFFWFSYIVSFSFIFLPFYSHVWPARSCSPWRIQEKIRFMLGVSFTPKTAGNQHIFKILSGVPRKVPLFIYYFCNRNFIHYFNARNFLLPDSELEENYSRGFCCQSSEVRLASREAEGTTWHSRQLTELRLILGNALSITERIFTSGHLLFSRREQTGLIEIRSEPDNWLLITYTISG